MFQFIEYALRGLADGLNEQIRIIQDQQLRVQWHDFIHRTFEEGSNKTRQRQKRLLLDMSHRPEEWQTTASVREVSPRVAALYAAVSQRAIQRDVSELLAEGLLERNPENERQFRPNIHLLSAFLPRRVSRKERNDP